MLASVLRAATRAWSALGARAVDLFQPLRMPVVVRPSVKGQTERCWFLGKRYAPVYAMQRSHSLYGRKCSWRSCTPIGSAVTH